MEVIKFEWFQPQRGSLFTKLAPFLGAGFLILACTFPYMTFYMRLASLSYLLMVSGLYLRRDRTFHISLMATAMVTDLSLVLILEFQRQAIHTALSFKLLPLQQGHILFSTLALLTYFPVATLGILRFRNKGGTKCYTWHKRLGLTAFFFRTIGFLLMFTLIKVVP